MIDDGSITKQLRPGSSYAVVLNSTEQLVGVLPDVNGDDSFFIAFFMNDPMPDSISITGCKTIDGK